MKTTAHTPLAARNRSVSPAGTRSMASYLDDRRPQTALQAKLAATITGGSRSVQLQRNLAQLFASPVQTKMPEEESLQAKMSEDEVHQAKGFDICTKGDEEIPQRVRAVQRVSALEEEKPVQRQTSSHGLPAPLRSGIESLSGMDMSDVQVHHNSSQPAQLNALAYTQDSHIHLGPGHEKHLPHEAWHVVQQRQGRVRPTIQAKGVAINDDSRLEKEADRMGQQAAQMIPTAAVQKKLDPVNQPRAIGHASEATTAMPRNETTSQGHRAGAPVVQGQFEPSAQEEASLKTQIRQKWMTLSDSSVDTAVGYLKAAKNKKQAEAVLVAITKFNDLKLLAQVKYAGVTDNASKTILNALKQAPLVAQQAAIQAQAIQQDNQRINGYLPTVNNNDFKKHRNGTLNKQLPIRDIVGNMQPVIARNYANWEGRLPANGHYIEWYPLAGGVRSPQKRFFTKRYDQNDLWYTEGGTHEAGGLWWHQSTPGGDWIKF